MTQLTKSGRTIEAIVRIVRVLFRNRLCCHVIHRSVGRPDQNLSKPGNRKENSTIIGGWNHQCTIAGQKFRVSHNVSSTTGSNAHRTFVLP